jgi:hypothetical protein
MHQSGQLRAHSMHAVQLSSLRAMTPRARVGGALLLVGYCTVAAPLDGDGGCGIGLSPSPGHMVWVISER